MTAKRPDLPSNSIWPTVAILMALTMVSCAIGWAVSFSGNLLAVGATGPFGWIAFGPAVVATYSKIANIGLVAVPIWTFLGGWFFGDRAGGQRGAAVSEMRVQFFSDTHEITRVTQRLAAHMGLPKVAFVGWFPNEEINAFAMGTTPHFAMIALSKGAIERLTKKELIAVIGHELGHVASNDMARMAYARGLQEALTFFLVFQRLKTAARWVFTPLSELELLRMSRAREFTADRIAAMMIGADSMIAALEKLQQETIRPNTKGHANVLMWSGISGSNLFSTHPPLEKRIGALRMLQKLSESMPQKVPPLPVQ